MRIVIDMQGAQTESRFRGIGRYTLSFVKAVVRNRGENEVLLTLSGFFPDTIEPIRAEFDGLLPQENIRVWHAPGPVKESEPGNENRRQVAELIREEFIASLQPDVVHITSLFEGYIDDAVTSIGRFDKRTPVTSMLFDLIPLLNKDQYLKPNPPYAEYYQRKLQYFEQAQMLLAISDFTRQEGIANLRISSERVVNISTAIEPCFNAVVIDKVEEQVLRERLGLFLPFVLYAGGADERKNLIRLIQAYAKLPETLRQSRQLVFAGKMPEGNVINLRQEARRAGLKQDELVFTGYVIDEDLAQLYKLSQLFVFPSWHEGFGLPALEAMACGTVVIGANTSSVPEVIGLQEALFDPMDVNEITTKLTEALVDDAFRTRLRNHGATQSLKFSWEETARKSWELWQHLPTTKILKQSIATPAENKLIHALACFLSSSEEEQLLNISQAIAQNASAGIERQLLLDVSELCQRDSATGVQRVVRSYLFHLLNNPPSGFRVLPVYASQIQEYRYATAFTARVLGQNEPQLMDQPIRWQRGDLFFGLDMQHHVQLAHAETYAQMRRDGVVIKFLVYDLLPIQLTDYFKDIKAKELHEQWLKMIAAQDEAICISKATANAYEEWLDANSIVRSERFCTDWIHMGSDLEGSKPSVGMPSDAQKTLKILRSRLTFLCVSTLEPRKAQTQILDAIEQLWAEGHDLNIVFVGQQGWMIDSLVERISSHVEKNKRLFWLKGISDEYLDHIYKASTCLVAASINEGFGLPLIEAARYGVPVIVRNIPVFHEIAGHSAYYFSGEEGWQLAQAINEWLKLYRSGSSPTSNEMRRFTWHQATEHLKAALVERKYQGRQLLVDISELVQRDAHTGIQRVVRNVLREWLKNPPPGYRVEPVYATETTPYRYASRYVKDFMRDKDNELSDEPINFAPGDLFFCLDLQPQVQIAHASFYKHLRQQGVIVKFLVHDLIPILKPEYFPLGTDLAISRWFGVIGECDGAICVSKTVAEELKNWMHKQQWNRSRRFKIDVNHNGVDATISKKKPVEPEEIGEELKQNNQPLTFLMVGTIEPRKGHEQVLDAFEQLWQRGSCISSKLVIVGKKGWMVDSLINRICNHPRLNERLFWFDEATDEHLEKLYSQSTCLISASYAEGFGLPLIEAAQHKLPIIARDIPVFREVSQGHAYFFKAQSPADLAAAIESWLLLKQKNIHPKSDNMPWITWEQSAFQLLQTLDLLSHAETKNLVVSS